MQFFQFVDRGKITEKKKKNQPETVSNILNTVCEMFFVRTENMCVCLRQYGFPTELAFRIKT
jgi:hypothetical protein